MQDNDLAMDVFIVCEKVADKKELEEVLGEAFSKAGVMLPTAPYHRVTYIAGSPGQAYEWARENGREYVISHLPLGWVWAQAAQEMQDGLADQVENPEGDQEGGEEDLGESQDS